MILSKHNIPHFEDPNLAIIRSKRGMEGHSPSLEGENKMTIEYQLEIRTRIMRLLLSQVPLDFQEADVWAPVPESGFCCCLQQKPLPLPTVLLSSRNIQRQEESSNCLTSTFHVSPACISWEKSICIQNSSCEGAQGISTSFPFQALQEGGMEVSQLNFCKGQDSQYFQVCRFCGLCGNYSVSLL